MKSALGGWRWKWQFFIRRVWCERGGKLRHWFRVDSPSRQFGDMFNQGGSDWLTCRLCGRWGFRESEALKRMRKAHAEKE